MTDTQHEEEESIISRLARTALMHVASAGIVSAAQNGVDQAIAGTTPADVTGLNGAQITDGSTLHHGPADAGDLLDRPAGGYLAHASSSNGVIMQNGHDISSIARDIDKAGTLTMDGHSISVLDYVPGGDFVQIAAGHADPTQIMMTLAQHGIERELGGMAKKAVTGGGRTESIDLIGDSENDRNSSGPGSIGADDEHHDPKTGDGRHQKPGGMNAQHIPDADENARDLEQLAVMHKMDLDAAVETSDQSSVHTEIHAHGRTLEIDTEFEARAASNDAERAEASEHVEEVAHGSMTEHEHDAPNMHFRSKVQAHLDAMAKDEGMSM